MKKITYGLFLAILVLVPYCAFAQMDTLKLDDYSRSGNNYLNALIAADSASTAFVNNTRVYCLKKDGLYKLTSPITSYQGKNIIITTDPNDAGYDGTGLKPELIGFLNTSNKLPGYIVDQQNGGLIELHNLALSDYADRNIISGSADSLLAYMQGGLVHIGAVGGTGRIKIDNCNLHGCNGNHIRTDGKVDTVIVTNTIFSDMGNLMMSNFGAGKAFDFRDVAVTYAKIQNCTFVNSLDRIVRHYNSKQPISNFIFDHNTVVNSLSYHGFLSLGKVDSTGSGTLQITNNLLVDHFGLGADTSYLRQAEFSDPGERDPLNNQYRMAWVLTNKNDAAVWTISNNYYAITDSAKAIQSLTDTSTYLLRPYIGQEDPFLTWNMNKRFAALGGDTTTTFKKVSVNPVNYPAFPSLLARWIYTKRGVKLYGTYSGDGKQKNSADAYYLASKVSTGVYALDFNRQPLDYYRLWEYYTVLNDKQELNLNYYSSQNLATAGTDGKVIGDTRWSFLGLITSVTNSQATPNKYSLSQNYPNPFNPSTNFTINMKERGLVQVKIFDILGRQVASLVNEVMEAGSHPITWNAVSMPSGVYFYQMKAGSFVETKKMLLLK